MKKYFTIVAMALMTIHANAWEETLLFEKDWTSASEYDLDLDTENDPDYQLALGADGLAITNLSQRDWAENSQTIVARVNLALETNHDYIVRLTMKAPSEGTYQVKLETADVNIHPNMSAIAKASDDFQEIDFPFFHFSEGVDGEIKIHLGNGLLVGTTILQKVQVLERTKSVAAEGQLGYRISQGFVELTPDESFVYKFVKAMDDESLEAIRGLYDNMKKTGDKSILACPMLSGNVAWFVKKDYPLPEGKYFESDFYNSSIPNNQHENEYEVILPQIQTWMNYRGHIEDLLEYLGDRVTVDLIKEEVIEGYEDYKITDFRLICNLKTSEEWLKLCMDVDNYGFEGLPHFVPQHFMIDKTYYSHLISMMKETNGDEKKIYSMNWEGVDYPMTDMTPDDPQKTTDEGLAIYNPEKQEYAGSIFTIISGGGFSLEKNHDYMVRLTIKVPSDGSYVVNIGSGSTNCSKEVAVSASNDFQVIDVQFPDFWGDVTDRTFEPINGDAHIFFYSGLVAGTTVVKKVEIFDKGSSEVRGEETAIQMAKTSNADDTIYNLAGQRVDASYKGVVIKNGKKYIMR